MSHKNIVFIITHDTGRHLECYGEDVRTPNLNMLAEEGIIFTNHYCTAPQCSPSRGSIFSGLMPHSHGMIGLVHRGFSLKENIPYLPRILKNEGYTSILFGLQHECEYKSRDPNAKIKGPEILGYEKVVLGKSLSCRDITPLFIDYIKTNQIKLKKRPFFFCIGFSETHRKYPKSKKDPSNIRVPKFLPDHPLVKKDIADLNVSVERVDKAIGKIVRALKETGFYDNTVIIFTTDHGIAFPGAKATLFDPGISTALIMRGGIFEGGKRINSLLSNIDLMPSLLEYLEIETPKEVEGKSFLEIIKGRKKEIREEIFAELTYHAAYDPIRCIRTHRYKYIKNFEIRPWYLAPNIDNGYTKDLIKEKGYFDRLRPSEFLFDLKEDPYEKQNLASKKEYQNIKRKLKKQLKEWMSSTDDPILKSPVPLPEKGIVTIPWKYDPKKVWTKYLFED